MIAKQIKYLPDTIAFAVIPQLQKCLITGLHGIKGHCIMIHHHSLEEGNVGGNSSFPRIFDALKW